MYLDAYFDEFFKEVNPKDGAIERAQKNHLDVRAFLASKDGLGDLFIDSFPAGSYRRLTAIDPIKDVDVVVVMKYTEADAPLDVLRHLRKTLKKKYTADDETADQRRSVRVDLDKLSMDIIPAIAPNGTDKPIKIPDRKLKKWIWTHPKGHIDLAEKKNAASAEIGGQHIYKPTVKLLRWWKHHQLPKQRDPKGFLVEVMAYECAPGTGEHWASELLATMDAIATKYRPYRGKKEPPVFTDPALPEQQIGTKLTAAEFTTFLDKLDDGRDILRRAIAAEDRDESAELYCQLFVKGFPCPESGKKVSAIVASERRVTEPRRFA